MFPKTFRVSDIVEWRWKIVAGERTGVYENAHLPISVRQRGLMYWAVSADRRPDLIWFTATSRTMSEEYVGHWPVWIECIMVHNLKSTRRSTGNQWSCLRAGVTCSFIRRSRISRAAAFWTRWSGMIADFGRPTKTELPQSRLERTNECTSWATSSCPTGRRIWRSRRSWYKLLDYWPILYYLKAEIALFRLGSSNHNPAPHPPAPKPHPTPFSPTWVRAWRHVFIASRPVCRLLHHVCTTWFVGLWNVRRDNMRCNRRYSRFMSRPFSNCAKRHL